MKKDQIPMAELEPFVPQKMAIKWTIKESSETNILSICTMHMVYAIASGWTLTL